MPTRGPLALLLLLVLLAAGCVAPGGEVEPDDAPVEASPVRFDVEGLLVERLALELDDGVRLDVATFRPDVAKAGFPDEKVPVLADIGPYFGNLAGPMETLTGFDQRLAEYFVPRGYAVARVSVRGTGHSEGCFGIGDEQERKDVAAAVEFLAAQPWSNGGVAVIGKSYDGTTPWMAAIENPPSLKTIVPISGISDMYRYTFYDGVPYPETTAFHTYYPLLVDHDVAYFPPEYYPGHERQNLVRTCPDLLLQAKGGNEGYLTGNHGTPYWQARDYEPLMDKVQVPVFLVHGLQDWNVKPDNSVPQYAKLDVPKAMWLGQWAHDYPDINRFNEEWNRQDWNETLLVWFDHWLKDAENGWEQMAHVEVQDTAGRWRTYGAWPPEDADLVTLHPDGEGGLALAPGAAATRALRDPLARGHAAGSDGPEGASFVTGPLPADATLLGQPLVDVHLAVDMPGGHLVAKLWDVGPDGEWKMVAHGARDLRHRESRDQGSDVPRGTPFNMTITMYAQQTLLAAGHKLGLTLSVEDPDRFMESPWRLATYAIHLGGDEATALHVQLHPGDGPALERAASAASGETASATQSPAPSAPPAGSHEIII